MTTSVANFKTLSLTAIRSDILQWDVHKLEASHDYIQTLFPLPEESGVNWNAPVIDRQVFEAFRSRPELRSKMTDALRKMLWFYGFALDTDGTNVKVKQAISIGYFEP